jgi:hypothetical protein
MGKVGMTWPVDFGLVSINSVTRLHHAILRIIYTPKKKLSGLLQDKHPNMTIWEDMEVRLLQRWGRIFYAGAGAGGYSGAYKVASIECLEGESLLPLGPERTFFA